MYVYDIINYINLYNYEYTYSDTYTYSDIPIQWIIGINIF